MNPTEHATQGDSICAQLWAEIRQLELPEDRLPPQPVFGRAAFDAPVDPYSGEASLRGVWRGARGERLGEITLHADGTFYAEYDVAQPHPRDRRWFVEGVIAWGRGDTIKSEAKLLPAL